MSGNVRIFRGTEVSPKEIEVLKAFEELTDKRFEVVDHIGLGTSMGFVASQGHVTGLGLEYCEFSFIPKEISRLSFLEFLSIRNNKIRIINPSIGKLTSL